MKSILKLLGLVIWLMSSLPCYAQAVAIETIDYPRDGQDVRIVFDGPSPKGRVFMLENPARLVVDLPNTRLTDPPRQPGEDHPLIGKVRSAVRNGQDIRLVVDLKQAGGAGGVSYKTHFEASELMVDLMVEQDGAGPSTAADLQTHEWVVAIDAGHGGSDPGARGVHGALEKDITLKIAKKLAALFNQQAGIKAVLTREDDRFIALRERIEMAREANADLFVSIHADAYEDTSVQGASVYTLSKHGASSEAARWLAEKENSADLLGGISLNEQGDDLASVLLDLAQNATLEHSSMIANEVLKSFGKVNPLHKNTVQKAGFIVLTSPDIPSILVETAFISNPAEERNLISEAYQAKLAKAIYNGIISYLDKSNAVGGKMAGL